MCHACRVAAKHRQHITQWLTTGRAKIRQEYILQRMRDLKYISSEQYATAMLEDLTVRGLGREFEVHAELLQKTLDSLQLTCMVKMFISKD
jgi:membrane carboxypeptidase/penicillin-binding protein